MTDIVTWTWHGEPYDDGSVAVGTGSRTYKVIKLGEDGPDQFPWVLLPPYDGRLVMRYTNPSRAMDGAELWERDLAMFYALASGTARQLLDHREREAQR